MAAHTALSYPPKTIRLKSAVFLLILRNIHYFTNYYHLSVKYNLAGTAFFGRWVDMLIVCLKYAYTTLKVCL